jgi:hypothetical protein
LIRTKHKNCNRNFLSLLKERTKTNNKEGMITNKELCLINKEKEHAKVAIIN